jgi:hypothetical protein
MLAAAAPTDSDSDSDSDSDVMMADGVAHQYWLTSTGAREPEWPAKYTKVGAERVRFTGIEVASLYSGQMLAWQTAYGLDNDTLLFGRSARLGGGRRAFGHGFAGGRSFALISRTATYDTSVANLRGCGLYTIHLPRPRR